MTTPAACPECDNCIALQEKLDFADDLWEGAVELHHERDALVADLNAQLDELRAENWSLRRELRAARQTSLDIEINLTTDDLEVRVV